VHYVEFRLTPDQVDALATSEQVSLAVTHPEYPHVEPLGADTVAELRADAGAT